MRISNHCFGFGNIFHVNTVLLEDLFIDPGEVFQERQEASLDKSQGQSRNITAIY